MNDEVEEKDGDLRLTISLERRNWMLRPCLSCARCLSPNGIVKGAERNTGVFARRDIPM
jgi:hypothetical protein